MNFSYIVSYVSLAVHHTQRIKRTILKTLKENNSKVTKDVLLHQIFQEISEENKEIDGDNYLLDDIIPVPKTKLSKIREIQKKRQWFFIAILLISIIYVLFNTNTGSTQSEVQKSDNDIYAIPKANQIAQQEEETVLLDVLKEEAEDHNIITKTNPIQIIEKKEVKTQTVIKLKEPLTAREKAKEALFMQMQTD